MVTLKKTQVKVISVLIALVFVGSVVALALTQAGNMGIAQAASSSNVGVVEYRQVLASYKEATDVQEEMQKYAQEVQQEFESKSANMSDAEKQSYYQQCMQRLQQKQQELTDPVMQQIEAACKEVADAQGLTVVLQKDSVVYGGKDITQDVIKKLSK